MSTVHLVFTCAVTQLEGSPSGLFGKLTSVYCSIQNSRVKKDSADLIAWMVRPNWLSTFMEVPCGTVLLTQFLRFCLFNEDMFLCGVCMFCLRRRGLGAASCMQISCYNLTTCICYSLSCNHVCCSKHGNLDISCAFYCCPLGY